LAFPGAVADIVQRKSFDVAVDGDHEGPPDRVRAEPAFGEVFPGDGHFVRRFFEMGQFANQFQEAGAIFAGGAADSDDG
jgi:hypothetical protein